VVSILPAFSQPCCPHNFRQDLQRLEKTMPITIRPARAADRDAIIAMHVEMSRKAYGHILSDYYFAEVLQVEKDKLWTERFAAPVDPERLSIMVADADGVLAGFTSAVFDPSDK
jgi:hypothetical protein